MASNSAKAIGLLAILLPVFSAIYAEQQKRVDFRRQHVEAEIYREQSIAENNRQNDREMAMTLIEKLSDIDPDKMDSFCAYFQHVSMVVSTQPKFTYSVAGLISALNYRSAHLRGGQDNLPVICDCVGTLGTLQDNLRPPNRTGSLADSQPPKNNSLPSDRAGSQANSQPPTSPLASAVGDAINACDAGPDKRFMLPLSEPARGTGTPSGREEPSALPSIDSGAAPNCELPKPDRAVTVYIQIPNSADRERAIILQRSLQAAGYLAPGIEEVDCARSPSSALIKRFHPDDDQWFDALAAGLNSCAKKIDLPELKPVKLGGYANVPRRIFEIWYPKNVQCLQGGTP